MGREVRPGTVELEDGRGDDPLFSVGRMLDYNCCIEQAFMCNRAVEYRRQRVT